MPMRDPSAASVREPGATLRVPHEGSGVRLARRALTDQLVAAGVEGQTREDAMLVVSELLSNAVKHATPLPSGQITVRWAVDDDDLHLEITDGGASTRPRAGVAALSALGGRGLDIVRRVSRRWGVTEGQGQVTVWADVPRSARGVRRGPAAAGR